jgi:hypothetical protein
LNGVKRFGSEHMKDAVGAREDPDADYSTGIPVARRVETGDLLRLDVTDTTKIGLFGPSGSGKTIFGKAIASRLHTQGYKLYNGADVKHDFQSLDYQKGPSKKLIDQMGFAPHEQPQPIPKQLLMPRFMAENYETVPSYVEPFSFGFQDLSEQDLLFLLGEGNLDMNKKTVLRQMLDHVDIHSTSFGELREALDMMDPQHGLKKVIDQRLDGLEQTGLISNRYRKDVVKYLQKGAALSLGMETWRQFQRGDMYMLQFYAGKVFEQVKEANLTENRLDGPFVGLFPEVHHFAPAGEDSQLTDELQELVTQSGRQMIFVLILDSQTPSQIPNPHTSDNADLLGNLNHVFMGCDPDGNALGRKEWSTVLKSMNMLAQNRYEPWRRKMQQLRPHDFLYVNPRMQGPHECPVVRSLAPLVAHPK